MYAVLKRDDNILASEIVENKDNKYHSAFLISTLQDILSKNNVNPQDVDLIAINIGPGSFTGIRACTTVARVMAQQLGCKAIGISSLEILAKSFERVKHVKNPLVALDARKNMAYLWRDGEICGAVLLDDIKEMIEHCEYDILTDNKLQLLLGGMSYQQLDLPLGEVLADLASEQAKSSECNWGELLPLYIQPPPMG